MEDEATRIRAIRAAYAREWRKKNKDKAKKISETYWLNKMKRQGVSVKLAVGSEVCYKYPNPLDGRKKLIADPRSFKDEKGYWHIHPFAFSKNGVHIVCPYCGDIHIHSKAPGSRVPHCLDKAYKKDYIIERWFEND